MKTTNLFRIILFTLFGLTVSGGHASGLLAKKASLKFYPNGNDMVVTINETDDLKTNDFFFIQLNAPLRTGLLNDGQYDIYVRKDFLILKGKDRSFGFTVDPHIISTAFKQNIVYILVNGIVEGHSDEPMDVNQIMNGFRISKDLMKATYYERKGHLKTCRKSYTLYCTQDGRWCRCVKEEEENQL